jgi:hypothetical protein
MVHTYVVNVRHGTKSYVFLVKNADSPWHARFAAFLHLKEKKDPPKKGDVLDATGGSMSSPAQIQETINAKIYNDKAYVE